MDKLKVAVIGTGNMGRNHMRNYFEMPRVNLVAICDVNRKAGEQLALKYGCLFYEDYHKMFNEQQIDAVSIAVPTFLHHQVASDVLMKKVHVLLEKPIAVNLEEARDIITKAKEQGVKLMIGHIERFNPAVQRVKELIDTGRFGKIISLNIKRVGGLPPQLKQANVVIDLAIHDIDISNYLFGDLPEKIYGYKSKNLLQEQEDSANILLQYKRGCSFIEVNWVTPVKIRNMDITGTKAFARLDFIHQKITLYENCYLNEGLDSSYKDFGEFVSKFSLTDKIEIGVNAKEPLQCELEEFINCIVEDREPIVSGEDGYKALEVALKF
ncbi:MAG: Gfo/Idh/MocA family oxidoreductase [Patescibacteria group bacterium]|nr:Gfo/Idh/MocA family oxidoreductase [Patescibacteria group bacterium]